MNIRKITSMTMFVSFVLLVLTSVILYIVPHGRVAYWADWHLWGLTKTEWGNLHINLGFLFLLAGMLHIFYNWAPLKAYMKNKARELKVFTPSFNMALLLTLVVGVGTYLEVPPMSTVIQFGDSIKDAASKKYGEPPYGHAELSSLKLFAKKQGLDLEKAVQLLKDAGVNFGDPSEILGDIARANKMSPQQVYTLIKTAAADKGGATGDAGSTFPDSPMPGFGNRTLADVCHEYNLMFPVIQQGLKEKGISAKAEMTIKEIAAENGLDPMGLFEAIHEVASKK